MTTWLIVIACFAGGYWLVGKLMGAAKDAAGKPRPWIEPYEVRKPAPRSDRVDETVTLSNWYRILGVSEMATAEQISHAYKRAISRHHPDKVAQMSEEIRELADARSKQINAAYELGMRRWR